MELKWDGKKLKHEMIKNVRDNFACRMWVMPQISWDFIEFNVKDIRHNRWTPVHSTLFKWHQHIAGICWNPPIILQIAVRVFQHPTLRRYSRSDNLRKITDISLLFLFFGITAKLFKSRKFRTFCKITLLSVESMTQSEISIDLATSSIVETRDWQVPQWP